MIYYIKGYITEKMPGAVAIEKNGIAYYVNVPDNCQAYLLPPEKECTLYTSMIVREDDISLYGFSDKASLSLFKLLQTVSGVGAKAALAILSVGSASAIAQAIVFEDESLIQKANGVGKKIAQRVVLELKDKLSKNTEILEFKTEDLKTDNNTDVSKKAALDALMALGYSKTEASSALLGIKADSTEEYISKALKNK